MVLRAAATAALIALAACTGGALPFSGFLFPTGSPCTTADVCAGASCLSYPDGYCSQACGTCGDDVCLTRGDGSFCHQRCQAPGDCRAGYQCFGGACLPPCSADGECGAGFLCSGGSCAPRPGKARGEPCTEDGECSSGHCAPHSSTCDVPCRREADCPAGHTCFYNPIDGDGNGAFDTSAPVCRSRRPGRAPPGSACSADDQCEQGQCQYGVCTLLCDGGTCPTPLLCKTAFAALDDAPAPLRQCLPPRGVLEVDLGDAQLAVGVPEHAVSLGLWIQHATQDFDFLTGFTEISHDSVQLSSTLIDPYKNPIRYYPSEGGSMAYLSNSPLVAFKPGTIYGFNPFSARRTGGFGAFSVRARVRVSDRSPINSGRVAIHVFITDLRGGCYRGTLNAANAHATLATFEARVAQVLAQGGITIDEWKYADTAAGPEVHIPAGGNSSELAEVLKTATTGDAPDVLEVVLVRRIDDENAMPGFQVLGIAGGVPAAFGIPGTLHSGVAVSIAPLCMAGAQNALALVTAHELGHSLGLFHTVESDRVRVDQMSDNDQDGSANLMYWAEGSNQGKLSPQQTAVLRHNPVVRD